MSDLPDGWEVASLDQLVDERGSITDGPFGSNLKTAHYTTSGPRVIRLQNIGDGVFLDEEAHISEEHFQNLHKHEVIENDVVVASLGERLPRACLAPRWLGPAIVKADCIRVRPAIEVLPSYLMLALNSPQIRSETTRKIKGVGRPRINLGQLRQIEVAVPPLFEQHRIVESLAAALSRIEAGQSYLNDAGKRLGRLEESILRSTFTQTLDGSEEKFLADVAHWSSGGTPKADDKSYYDGLIPWAVIGDLNEGVVRDTASTITELGLSRSSAKIVPEDTVLIAMYGASIGRLGIAGIPMATNQAIACAQVREDVISSRYLFWYLRSLRSDLIAAGKGAAQPNIGQGTLKAWPISLPERKQQDGIIADLEQQLSVVYATRNVVRQRQRSAHVLRNSYLASAVSGKLVAQESTDEPASALLERIRLRRELKDVSRRQSSKRIGGAK